MASTTATPGRWSGLRTVLHRHRALIALALLAPSIPELLTGSTAITVLFFDPLLFVLQFAGIVALYGGGALLIREAVVYFHRGWGSVLLLGAAYGIGEEAFAVHTFFQPAGAPVDAFGSYGHAFGVDWLWALGLTIFHATYSIALPILLVNLFYPDRQQARWLSRRGVAVTACIYLGIVGLFAVTTPHGPTTGAFVVFAVMASGLIALALALPSRAVRLRVGPGWLPSWGVALAASLPFDTWTFLDFQSGRPLLSAAAAGGLLVAMDLAAFLVVTQGAGDVRPDWVKYDIAVGMLAILFVWDVILEFAVPGILLVTAVFVYLLYRLRGVLHARERPTVPTGALGAG